MAQPTLTVQVDYTGTKEQEQSCVECEFIFIVTFNWHMTMIQCPRCKAVYEVKFV